MSRRSAAVAVILAWLAGLGILIRREYFRPQLEQLADAALRVSPGAVYYAVMDGDRQVGFASSTLDTTRHGISLRDYFLRAPTAIDTLHRDISATTVQLSRGLRLLGFHVNTTTPGRLAARVGVVEGDSAIMVIDSLGGAPPASRRIALDGPALVPGMIPIAVVLGTSPKVGKRYTLPVFDPATARERAVSVEIHAESSFVVSDTAVFDSTSARWRSTHPDTLKGWQVTSDGPGGFTGWVDDQGRVLATEQAGLSFRRLPYEVAFENWRLNTAPTAPARDLRRPPI